MIEFVHQWASEMSAADESAYLLMVGGVIWLLVGVVIGLKAKGK
jgi:hypothetical protein